ncbi:MAG: hypothetical protein RKE49_00800 [Oceanicaulis sp.]
MRIWSSGNVLFLILLAVALFAALSYAVTQAGRSGGKDISREKAELGAAEIIQYFTLLENTIQRMRLTGSVKLEHLDVSASGYSNQAANSNCSTSRCRLFHPDGGGVSPRRLNTQYTDLTATNWNGVTAHGESVLYFMNVGVENVGTSLADLVVLYGGVKLDICRAINVRMGLTTWNGPALTDSHGTFAEHAGDVNPYPNPDGVLGDDASEFSGQRTFCSEQSGAWGSYAYQVLVAR